MDDRFKVLFRGELAAGQTPDEVKQKLAKLYKVPVQKLEPWFSGRTVTIKANLDRAAAENYKRVFEQAGAICMIESEGEVKEPAEPTVAAAPTAPQPPTEARINLGVSDKKEQPNKKPATPKRNESMEKLGFMAGLFDFSFTEFITPRIVKLLFILAIIASAFGGLAMLFSGFKMLRFSTGMGIFLILISPFAFVLYVLIARVWLEILMVVFRIAENTTRLVEKDQ